MNYFIFYVFELILFVVGTTFFFRVRNCWFLEWENIFFLKDKKWKIVKVCLTTFILFLQYIVKQNCIWEYRYEKYLFIDNAFMH